MMRQMRENTKWIMLITALAFVALMVFEWGMDLTGRSSAQFSGGEIGRVNGQPITYEEYFATYQNLYTQQSQALGTQPISNTLNRQIEDAAFEQVVMQKLIGQELRRRGLQASDQEVREAARYFPPQEIMSDSTFWTDGQFDLQKYHAFLSSPALDPQSLRQLEQYYRESIPRTKLYYRTTAGTYVGDNELWRMWRDTRDAVSVRYLSFDPAQVVPAEGINVSASEISRYYREHQDDFVRPARARIRYVVIDRTPTAADTVAARERIEAIAAELDAGADFAEVAERESADSASAVNGGLMQILRGQTIAPFDSVAFSIPVGRLSAPVRTEFGYHVLRVDSREGDTADVRHVLVPIERTEESRNALLDRADSLEALTSAMNLQAAAQNLGLEVRESEIVPGLALLPGLLQAEDGEDWAFNDGEIGEVSSLFESPRAFYAFELLERQDERTLSQQEAEPTIREAVAMEKRIERTLEVAREALERIRGGTSFEDVAASLQGVHAGQAGPFTRGDFVPDLGRFTPAVGTAFGLRPGQTSGAVESDRRVFILQAIERTDADRAAWEQQKPEQRMRVMQAASEQRWQQFLDALRRNADIVDNRNVLLNQPAAARF
jgi:peptidyl-prolyl cis-trans isomerase D